MDPERILIIRTGGLGDTLLLWPAVAGVRRRFPRARIDLMGNRDRCELLAVPGGADTALDVDGSGLHHLFDMEITLPADVQARFGVYDLVIAFAAPGDYALAENLSACGAREVHAFLPVPPDERPVHVSAHAQTALMGVDLAAPGEATALPVTDRERVEGAEHKTALGIDGRKFAVVAPGSGAEGKNWAPERFAQVVTWLSEHALMPVLIEGPADASPVASVLAHLDRTGAAVLREHTPSGLKGFLREAALLIGNDSGVTHLAGIIGVPTVAVFGPTNPVLWAPLGPRTRVVRPDRSCAPCTSDVQLDCDQRDCLADVEVDEVTEAAEELLSTR